MRAYERVADQLIQKGQFQNQVVERIFYERTRFWTCTFSACSWRGCKFHGTSFANGCTFQDCRFTDCRFWGQHTHMGGPAVFDRCVFDRCQFRDITFWATVFRECTLTGVIRNVAFFGPEGPPEWLTTFKGVDLSGTDLQLVDFRLGFDLSTTRLPGNAKKHNDA